MTYSFRSFAFFLAVSYGLLPGILSLDSAGQTSASGPAAGDDNSVTAKIARAESAGPTLDDHVAF